MLNIANEFIKSVEFVDYLPNIDPKYVELTFVVRDHSNKPSDSYFEENFKRIFFPDDANAIINSDLYRKIRDRVTNSIIASAIVSNVSSATKSLNVFVAYTLHLIKLLATNSVGSTRIGDSTIIIPREIFPLPQVKDTLKEMRKEERERQKRVFYEYKQKIEETSKLVVDNNEAISEMIGAYEKRSDYDRKVSKGFILSHEISNNISSKTKQILQYHGLVSDEIDVAKSVAILEKFNIAEVNKFSRNISAGTKMTRLGSVLLPSDYFGSYDIPVDIQGTLSIVPGVCHSPYVGGGGQQTGVNGEVTTPIGHGQAHAYGFSDLMVVEQELSHYEYGEIAHIENVLKGEIRERKHRTSRTREEAVLTETEETSEKTEDLTTTERYELGTESQHVINENSSTQIGITVNASYGPSVDVTGNYNYSTGTSTQDSKSASSNFARETSTRAINRLEKRKLHRRFVRTIEEVTELNKHIFENQEPNADNISGIYRWIDKIYTLQIVNYGKRFMLEFIVPEPAAFVRHAMSKLPNEDNVIVKPDPPGWCLDDGKTFHALQVEDIKREDYLIWVAKYNVQDVSPPPPRFITASQSKILTTSEVTKFEELSHRLSIKDGSVEIPDGYFPQEANVNLSWAGGTHGNMWVQVQGEQVSAADMDDKGAKTIPLPVGVRTPSVPYTIDSNHMYLYGALINISCILSLEKFAEWQLNTYNAIMTAYNVLKSKYDDYIQAIKIRTGYSEIRGRNPFFNRELEKLEMKKGCISLLTGQRFDLFDSVKKNVPPFGYPEIIDFNEALVDGEYIRHFEQAFEWNNMTYVFYPYFWGNKEDWIMLSKIEDDDLLFARFLQAGAARVLVPVRPGFEKSIVEYLELEDEWNAEGTVITEGNEIDPFNISIIDEIKSQTGNNSVDGKGTLKVKKGSAAVTGTDTEFRDGDENRRIIIKGKTYVIKKIENETKIILTSAYTDNDDTGVAYALGGILVGQSWEVKLPTNLVRLDSNADVLIK